MKRKTLNLVIFVQGTRGMNILHHLQKSPDYNIIGVIADEGARLSYYNDSVRVDDLHGLDVCYLQGRSPNDASVVERLAKYEADIFVLAGCRHILQEKILALPKFGTIGIHNGKLPDYRGSSPLNWALIRGCFAHGISVMEVALRVDGGRVIEECNLPISIDATIKDLHDRALSLGPNMVVKALEKIALGEFKFEDRQQKQLDSSKHLINRYVSKRFPSDGCIDWKNMTAWQVHNMIRALTEPYPCAYIEFQGKRWRLMSSRLSLQEQIGKEGRVYGLENGWMLVAAKDKCVWVKPEESLLAEISRYTIFD